MTNLRTEAEKRIEEARASVARFERIEAGCAIQLAELRIARIEVQKKKGNVKDKARAMEAIARLESDLATGAKAAAESRVKITASVLALQDTLDRLKEVEP